MDVTDPTTTADARDDEQTASEELLSDDLVEEISIDGMCGVY